jgi:hypothetical protein
VTEVRAQLRGHTFDLDRLAWSFPTGDPRVGVDDHGHYLTGSALDGLLDDGSILYERASSMLRRVNGVARALDGDFRPVSLTGRFSDETGRQSHVVIADVIEVRDQALPITAVLGGVPQEPPRPGPGYLGLSERNSDVADALNIRGTPGAQLSWSDLYKVFEIVRDSVGGERVIVKNGWVSQSAISRFKHSANHPEASGDQARHARMSGGPPSQPMWLNQVRWWISSLVQQWFDSLS